MELLYDPDNIYYDDVQMMSEGFLQMLKSRIENRKNQWHPLNASNMIKDNIPKVPKVLEIVENMEFDRKNLILGSLSGMFDYLKQVKKFDYVIGAIRFAFYRMVREIKMENGKCSKMLP